MLVPIVNRTESRQGILNVAKCNEGIIEWQDWDYRVSKDHPAATRQNGKIRNKRPICPYVN